MIANAAIKYLHIGCSLEVDTSMALSFLYEFSSSVTIRCNMSNGKLVMRSRAARTVGV
ncbi:MAG: hypothetical protein LAO20_08615 [Acidobacteriia bacterium]|nr:hypothetical protein [Terriglobia bacterium]